MVLKTNCSTYDPCGSFGHCEDDFEGQSTCSCTFWWEGSLCNKLTKAGKQVVVLSVINAIIVLYYYSLTIQRWFKTRSRQPRQRQFDPIRETVHENFPIPVKSYQIFTWLKGIVILIIGIISLIIKAVLLKEIHQEIVDKYHQHQPLYYDPPSFCRILGVRKEFNVFTFPLACLLIVLFTILTKRKSWRPHICCYGYVTIPVPLDFFAHINRTFAAVTFAIVANELANITNEFISENSASLGEGTITTYLLQVLRVLIIGFHCYPILAAVYINTRFTLICAIFYVWLDFALIIGFDGICQNSYYYTKDAFQKTEDISTPFYLDYYGTGSKLVFFQLLNSAPRYFCFAYMGVELPILLFKRFRSRRKSKEMEPTREQKNLLYSSLPYSIESQYVANLFRSSKRNARVNPIIRLFRLIYRWQDDFRFSSRVFCAYASVFLLLYYLTVEACVQVLPYLAELTKLTQTVTLSPRMNGTTISDSTSFEDSSFSFQLPNFILPYLFAIFTAFIVTMIQLLVLLTSIRRNLLQVFRGNDSEIPRWNAQQNTNYARNSTHFAGYLIGYALWGYVLIAFFTLIIGLFIDVLITYGLLGIIEAILKIAIPSLLLAIFQYYTSQLLGRFVFLQQGGDVLSLNHRRILMVYLYFNFFLDAFLGILSSITRLIKSGVGGIIYMCRLDYSPMGRKLESYEAGFSSYCGFIHMECAHRHPVLLYFASLLIRQQLDGTEVKRRSIARRRWHLAIFLLKNPTLVYRRKRTISTLSIDDTKFILMRRRNVIQPLPIERLPRSFDVGNSTA